MHCLALRRLLPRHQADRSLWSSRLGRGSALARSPRRSGRSPARDLSSVARNCGGWLTLVLGTLLMAPAPVVAGEADRSAQPDSETEVLERVERLDRQAAELDERADQLSEQRHRTRLEATDLERNWKGLLGQLERVRSELQQLKTKLQDTRESLPKLEQAGQQAKAELKALRDQDDVDKEKLEEQEKATKEARQAFEKAEQSIPEMKSRRQELAPQVDPLVEQAAAAEAEVQPLRNRIAELDQQLAELREKRHALSEQTEALLRQAGLWISFSDQIAPIFHRQCVGCHNVRNPQGRYNMVHYDAIMSPGQSGEVILPGDADGSLLVHLIEDGSMPYDSDPLEEDEIELVRLWVELGGRLDATAASDVPLVRVIPRPQQPPAPDVYHATLPVTALASSPAGTLLASSGYHEVLLWDLPSGQLAGRIGNVAQRVYGLAFHADGRRLAVAAGTPGRMGEVKLFDVDTGRLINDLWFAADAMFDVAWSPDGHRLAAAGAEGAIVILDVDDADGTIVIADHSDWVQQIAWSPGGEWLVSASRDQTAKLFEAATGRLQRTFSDHQTSVTAVQFVDGKRVLSGDDDGHLRLWQAADAKQTNEVKSGITATGVLIALDDGLVALAGAADRVQLHKLDDGQASGQWELTSGWVTSGALAADGDRLWLGNQAGQIWGISLADPDAPPVQWTAVPGHQH